MDELTGLCKNQNLCGLIPGMKRSEVYDLLGEPKDFLVSRKRKTSERSTLWRYGEDFQIYFDYDNRVTHINIFYPKDNRPHIPGSLNYLKYAYKKIPSSEDCIELLKKNNISFEKKYDIFLEKGSIDIFVRPYLHIIYEDDCKILNSIRLFL